MSEEISIYNMADGTISAEQKEAASSQTVQQEGVHQTTEIATSNGGSLPVTKSQELRRLLEERINGGRRLPPEVTEAQKKVAEYYGSLGLNEDKYQAFVTEGRRRAIENNGHQLSMEEVRENIRRLYPSKDKDPKSKT